MSALLNHFSVFATPWLCLCPGSLVLEFTRQKEYWSGFVLPLGSLPTQGIDTSTISCVAEFFTTVPRGKPKACVGECKGRNSLNASDASGRSTSKGFSYNKQSCDTSWVLSSSVSSDTVYLSELQIPQVRAQSHETVPLPCYPNFRHQLLVQLVPSQTIYLRLGLEPPVGTQTSQNPAWGLTPWLRLKPSQNPHYLASGPNEMQVLDVSLQKRIQ